MPTAKFKEMVASLPDDQRKTLLASRNQVWHHVNIPNLAISGEEQSSMAKNYLAPQIEQIEELAFQYCTNEYMVSPLMEWVMIDSLLFNETMAFVRQTRAKQSLLMSTAV